MEKPAARFLLNFPDGELLARIRTLAKREDRSVSSTMRLLWEMAFRQLAHGVPLIEYVDDQSGKAA
jgi:hypothetical protein